MRARSVVAVVVLGGALGFLAASGWPRASAPPPPGVPSMGVTEPATAVPLATSSRDPFAYADETIPARPAAAGPPASLEPSPPPAPVRLVGLVYGGGRLKAALAIGGEVHVLAAGEEGGGYLLLSVDEEQGARLRAPGGNELVVQPAER